MVTLKRRKMNISSFVDKKQMRFVVKKEQAVEIEAILNSIMKLEISVKRMLRQDVI
jgi:hypothetical protein